MAIISFDTYKNSRDKYFFKNRPLKVLNREGEVQMIPCIVMYEKETMIPVAYPGYERWYLNLVENEQQAASTLTLKASAVCAFLNYILQNTAVDALQDVTINIIRDFIADYRTKPNGEYREHTGWSRGVNIVYAFLSVYWEYNHESFEFAYEPKDLYSKTNVINPRKQSVKEYKANKFSVKPHKSTKKKYRFLAENYLDIVIDAARKYDPMIALAIGLQAYAGLREGEIANLTRKSLSAVYGAFNRMQGYSINLNKPAPFAANWTGKSPFGNIKIPREQEVYSSFVDKIEVLYQEHLKVLESVGASEDADAPLFVNKHGRPMSVKSYCQRVENLFYTHFLPALKQISMESGQWAKNAPFIEAYEAAYPGAHMFRHWFTMYLLSHEKLDPREVSRWRGDSNDNSIDDYMHVYGEMIRLYKKSVFRFQRSITEGII